MDMVGRVKMRTGERKREREPGRIEGECARARESNRLRFHQQFFTERLD